MGQRKRMVGANDFSSVLALFIVFSFTLPFEIKEENHRKRGREMHWLEERRKNKLKRNSSHFSKRTSSNLASFCQKRLLLVLVLVLFVSVYFSCNILLISINMLEHNPKQEIKMKGTSHLEKRHIQSTNLCSLCEGKTIFLYLCLSHFSITLDMFMYPSLTILFLLYPHLFCSILFYSILSSVRIKSKYDDIRNHSWQLQEKVKEKRVCVWSDKMRRKATFGKKKYLLYTKCQGCV